MEGGTLQTSSSLRPAARVQASAMSAQPTPQASPLTANGQASRVDPGDPSSPPLVQEGSNARSGGAAEAEQGPLPNGVGF